ncbi:hypothetical protein Q7C_617 [Methylophaga frappieri]|uniref:Uncharacterized protein n=1 Tax=Methylophaga frappieri (strain ATCC BAA-2434 / DSM 25690 / JAM7) TaxID=754477 RepID=I1YFU6_METFJ|nr:hypothetical protein [Methylophaga frappieri]AFJ01789.1 hypothetical protein Q7C_617 [Methylophaga frappieri]
MSSISALQSAYQGIQNGVQRASQNSAELTKAAANGGDIISPSVALKQAELQVAVSARALEVTNDTLGTILDITV